MRNISQSQLATEFAQRIVDNMDIDTLMLIVFEMLENEYSKEYTMQQLIEQVLEDAPDLLNAE
jgi:hypothetical protein